MKLKSIVIAGFKTFADRVLIQFHDGITGVIGPNGTGKSNVVAAVRWALGEQTQKNLRDPTEVIFAGSQNRKPLNMAEVTLTFTNDGIGCPPEFMHLPEISMGRRVFRDGTREYFMNKEPCRLRDIVDFLLAIGIAARGYSIIEQEKRDRIIQASPEGMREILEETAGISIFKQHRNDAEKRLTGTGEKMASLAEIESELKNQAENLKEQAVKVEEKKLLTDALRDREIALICHRVANFRTRANKLKKEISERTHEIQTAVIASGELESQANFLKAEQLDLQGELRDLENALEDKKIALAKYSERADSERRAIEDRLKRKQVLENTLRDEQAQVTREELRLNECLIELQQHEKTLKESDGLLSTLAENLDEAEESLRVDRGRGEELRSEIRALQELISTLRGRSESSLDRVSRANASLQKTTEQLSSLELVFLQLTADKVSHLEQLKQLSGGVEKIAETRSGLEIKLGVLHKELEVARLARDEAKQELLAANTSLQALQKLQSANEGMSDGTKALRTKFANLVKGFVFDYISVKPQDEHIVEQALPELLEAAIVDDQESLIDILDKAEEMDLSRVSFLVKNVIAPLSPSEETAKEKILSITGIRSLGDSLLNCQKPEIIHLVNRIFIARDEWMLFKAQREAAILGVTNFIFVSERGTVVSSTREIYFGKRASGDTGNMLQRKREISELEQKKLDLQKLLASLEGVLFAAQNNKNSLDTEILNIDNQLSNEKVEVIRLTSIIEASQHRLHTHEESLTRLRSDKESLVQEITSAQTLYAEQQSQIAQYDAEKRDYESDLLDFDSDQHDKKELRDVLVSKLNDIRQKRAVVAERAEHSRRSYEETSYQLKRLQNAVDKTLAGLVESNGASEASTEIRQALEREVAKLKEEVTIADTILEEKLSREAAVSEEFRVIENKIKAHKLTGDSWQKNISDKQMDLARFDTILETAYKEAQDKFLLSPHDLPHTIPEDSKLSEDSFEGEIVELRKSIDILGPVNERAAQEFTTVSERITFLANQKSDIEKSVLELRQAIIEIEETTKIRFKEIYEAVNTEFQKLFPTLFPGGEAHLNLTNPQDLLTTGVEILVRLPGKKQQRMHLFSGGEKALTAISLIFALLKTHPAPFCFLDEVDAPLDEANVGRFNEVLEMLSTQFQFIVITHNRRTMEVLDRIYGISMQDPGVSKLVAVDFTEVPEHLRKKGTPQRAGAVSASS